MGQLTKFPTLDAIQKIRDIVLGDTYLKSLYVWTNDLDSSTNYRIYKEPVDNKAIKGNSFSAWWQGEAPYNPQWKKQAPVFYLDIATQNEDMMTAVDNAWKYMRSTIETLRLDANLDGNVEKHWSTDIYPVDIYKHQIWTYILRCDYTIIPHKPMLYN